LVSVTTMSLHDVRWMQITWEQKAIARQLTGGRGREKPRKPAVRIVGDCVEIRTRNLPNASQKGCDWVSSKHASLRHSLPYEILLRCIASSRLRDSVDRLCGPVVWGPGYRCRGSGLVSRRYQIFWEVAGLERGPLSLASTTEELLGWKSSGSGLENREYSRRDQLLWRRGALYAQNVAPSSLTSCGRSAGIVRSRTQATGFSFIGKDNVLSCK
jgi:hypothetical protein